MKKPRTASWSCCAETDSSVKPRTLRPFSLIYFVLLIQFSTIRWRVRIHLMVVVFCSFRYFPMAEHFSSQIAHGVPKMARGCTDTTYPSPRAHNSSQDQIARKLRLPCPPHSRRPPSLILALQILPRLLVNASGRDKSRPHVYREIGAGYCPQNAYGCLALPKICDYAIQGIDNPLSLAYTCLN